MKVVFLLGSLNRGGTETLLLDTLYNIKTINIDCSVVYRKGGLLENDFKNLGIPLFQLAPKSVFDILYLWKLRKLLRLLNCDIAHAQQPLDALYAFLSSIGSKLKIILTIHGYDNKDSLFAKLILKFIIHKTHINIFVSNHTKQYYIEKYKLAGKSTTLYNGIDLKKELINKKTDLRTHYKIGSNVMIMGMVGNFVSTRDHMTVCHFLKKLKDKGQNFVFFFIGAKSNNETHLFDNCYQYCQDNGLNNNVEFLGSRNDVPAILKQLDAFVYSSECDTFGIAVIEAMVAGIPVFVNNWAVMNEITENGRYAHIYQSKNGIDLLTKFEVFLINQDLYKQEAIYNSRVIKEKYNIQNHLRGLHEIYRNIVKHNA